MAHGANIIDSRIRDARVPRYFPPLPSPVHPLLNAAITLKPIQRVLLPPLLPPLLPSFIVFYYRGCLEFRVRAILRGGIAIPCLSTIHSSFDRTMVVGRSLIGCIDVYRRPILGRSYRLIGGKREPRELEIGGRAKRGPDPKRETCDATARKFDCWNSWGRYGRRSFPSRDEGGKKPELAENSQLIYAAD